MILLDTHIWIWWVNGSLELSSDFAKTIQEYEPLGLGVSAISCWEVAKLVELGRLALSLPVSDWIEGGLSYPGVRLLDLSPEIAIASTQLPGTFHKDPADQILVATARVLDIPIMTADQRILDYPHVKLLRK